MSDFLRRIMGLASSPGDLPDMVEQVYTAVSCDDCLSEVNIVRESHPAIYILRVLHDETCPSLAGECTCGD